MYFPLLLEIWGMDTMLSELRDICQISFRDMGYFFKILKGIWDTGTPPPSRASTMTKIICHLGHRPLIQYNKHREIILNQVDLCIKSPCILRHQEYMCRFNEFCQGGWGSSSDNFFFSFLRTPSKQLLKAGHL